MNLYFCYRQSAFLGDMVMLHTIILNNEVLELKVDSDEEVNIITLHDNKVDRILF